MKTVNKEFYGCPMKVQLTKKELKITFTNNGNAKDFNDAVEVGLHKFVSALTEKKLEGVMAKG